MVSERRGQRRLSAMEKWTQMSEEKHRKDIPKLNGAVLGGDPAVRYSAPPSWDGKVEQVKELARRAGIRKRKLTGEAG